MSIDDSAHTKALQAASKHGEVNGRQIQAALEAYEAAKASGQPVSGDKFVQCETPKGRKYSVKMPEQPDEWNDKPDQWQGAIDNAHPTKTGKHKTYAKALEMVSNRHSKGALVDLVNWLLAYRRPTEVPDVD